MNTETKAAHPAHNGEQLMDDDHLLERGAVKKAPQRHVASFLIRFWLEPRETEDGTPPMRGYIRHLQTGEERYVNDTGMIAEYVLHQLRNGG